MHLIEYTWYGFIFLGGSQNLRILKSSDKYLLKHMSMSLLGKPQNGWIGGINVYLGGIIYV